MIEENNHPLSAYADDEKKAYLCVVASLAAVDSDVTDEEISNLRQLCRKVDLSKRSVGEVLATAEEPRTAPIKEYIARLATSDLRFTLLTDMLFLAYADRDYTLEERTEVSRIALELKVTSEQLRAIEDYVKAFLDFKNSGATSSAELKKFSGDVVAGLAATGVPVAAVAVSGSVWGLSTAGIISGLTALGLGLGVATGIGMVAIIGVASYFGVRWLYQKLTAEDDTSNNQ